MQMHLNPDNNNVITPLKSHTPPSYEKKKKKNASLHNKSLTSTFIECALSVGIFWTTPPAMMWV